MHRASNLPDALQQLVVELENDTSLVEPNQLRPRLEALERLDAHFPSSPRDASGAKSIETDLYHRARAVCAKLEAANRELDEAIRGEIQRDSRSDTLLQWVRPLLDIKIGRRANGIGYDYLDELISGVLQFDEPDAGNIASDPEKVPYQPTPARHIFSLIGVAALKASDVLIDLGSGLGHVAVVASICSEARCIGIELEKGYVECARKCVQRLGLHRVTFIQEDARVADLTGATVFYLYTPFRGTILRNVLDRLRRQAAARPIRICSYGPCTLVLAQEPWLAAAAKPEEDRIVAFSSRE
jgi:hypothetical protein